MGVDDPGKYITRPTVIMLFLGCVLIYYVFPKGYFTKEQQAMGEEEEEDSDYMSKRVRELENQRREEKKLERDFQRSLNPNDPNELIMGGKRYKLYEMRPMNFKRAESFCKKKGGQLAITESVEDMRRLQMLLKKAKMIADEIWVGMEKKKWKKHAWKDPQHPAGIDPSALEGMGAMMMGGGKREMCPALSSSTRAMTPAQCQRDLPFVCEFDRFATTTTTTSKPSRGNKKSKDSLSKGKKTRKTRPSIPTRRPKGRYFDEM